jgi:hypothetical protein
MTIWGTSREFPAQFEVGQGSDDLPSRFEAGQNSRNLPTQLLIRDAASTDLYAEFVTTHSQNLLGGLDIRHSATLDLLIKADIQSIGSANLQGTAYVGHPVTLYCKFEVGQDTRGLFARAEVRQPGSAELLGKTSICHSVELLGKGEIQQSDSSELLVWFEIGQDARDLLAKAEVRQSSIDLLGRCDIRQSSSADLLIKLSIPAYIDLYARFRPAQEVLNLSGRLVVSHPAFPIQLKAIFSIGLTNAYRDLGLSLEIGRSAFAELLGKSVIRHGDSTELLGRAEVRLSVSAELLGNVVITNIGSQDLMCSFTVGRQADLFAKFSLPIDFQDSVLVIADDNLAEFLEYVAGVGHGFIGEPSVEDDYSIKVVGENSFKITSNRGAGSYKEVRFGWKYGFVSPTPTAGVYFLALGEIEIRDTGSLWELV